MKCEVEGCHAKAVYAISGSGVWLQVCNRHDKKIGRENLRRWAEKHNSDPILALSNKEG